jgi:hypothetical protein
VPAPAVHYVWGEILESYFPATARDANGQPPKKKSKKKKAESSDDAAEFEDVFGTVVERSLLAPTASIHQKHAGLLVLEAALPRVPDDVKAKLLKLPVVRTWNNHLANKDRNLNPVAMRIASRLPHFLPSIPTNKSDRLGTTYPICDSDFLRRCINYPFDAQRSFAT